MLRVTVHSGLLRERTEFNTVGALDIAYQVKQPLADYLVGLTVSGAGQQAPVTLAQYPRWSASLWDLVARSLTAALYKTDQPPPSAKPDRRCAYSTRMCAVIQRLDANSRGLILGSAELLQPGPERGQYTVQLKADLAPDMTAQFAYGCKRLNPFDLLLRAVCWSLYGSDQLGPSPALILPPSMCMDGEDRFHVAALTEPALSGFRRFMAMRYPTVAAQQMAKATDYITFLRDA